MSLRSDVALIPDHSEARDGRESGLTREGKVESVDPYLFFPAFPILSLAITCLTVDADPMEGKGEDAASAHNSAAILTESGSREG